MSPEKLMDGIIDKVYLLVGEMVIAVKHERYEDAADIRDRVNDILEKVAEKLIEDRLTTMEYEELIDFLNGLKWELTVDWCDNLGIEHPQRD
jgi:aspartyl/asparaginyl-tRNA synthetase